ncbi:MAG: hypothetical protein ABI721_01510 [Candidatus Dojkabacteria bacterium]
MNIDQSTIMFVNTSKRLSLFPDTEELRPYLEMPVEILEMTSISQKAIQEADPRRSLWFLIKRNQLRLQECFPPNSTSQLILEDVEGEIIYLEKIVSEIPHGEYFREYFKVFEQRYIELCLRMKILTEDNGPELLSCFLQQLRYSKAVGIDIDPFLIKDLINKYLGYFSLEVMHQISNVSVVVELQKLDSLLLLFNSLRENSTLQDLISFLEEKLGKSLHPKILRSEVMEP